MSQGLYPKLLLWEGESPGSAISRNYRQDLSSDFFYPAQNPKSIPRYKSRLSSPIPTVEQEIKEGFHTWTKLQRPEDLSFAKFLVWEGKRIRNFSSGSWGIHKGQEGTGGVPGALRSSSGKAGWIFRSVLPVRQGEEKRCTSWIIQVIGKKFNLEEGEVFIKIWSFPFTQDQSGLQSGSGVLLPRVHIKKSCCPSNGSWAFVVSNSLVSQSKDPDPPSSFNSHGRKKSPELQGLLQSYCLKVTWPVWIPAKPREGKLEVLFVWGCPEELCSLCGCPWGWNHQLGWWVLWSEGCEFNPHMGHHYMWGF